MDAAARSGRLDMVQWLYENRTEGIIASAIRRAVERDQTEVEQWLRALS